MAEDMWTNIGEAISGPFKIAGAARQGLYDPYGQQRQMRQQRIDMNSMTMARQRLDDMLELGFQGIQSGTMTMDDVYGAVNIAVEQDPYLKNISAPIAKTYVDYMVKQTQKQQAMADAKAMHEKQQGFFDNLSEMKHLNPSVGNQLARNLGEDAGFAFGEGEILAGKDPDWVQIPTVGPDGKPVTQFVNRNQIPANATLPKYQSPDNQLFAIPGQPPQAINMNQPGAAPITTQLPPDATKMGTPSTSVNVDVNTEDQTPIETNVSIIAEKGRAMSANDPQYDYIPKYNPTKGGYYLEPVAKKQMESGEREKQVKRKVAMDNLQRLGELMDFSKIGPIQGRLTKITNAVGIGDTPESQELEVIASSMIKNTYVEGGKQLSDKEIERLIKYFPIDIAVADKKFEAQYNLFYNEVKLATELTDEQMEKAGFRRSLNVGKAATKNIQEAKTKKYRKGDTVTKAGKDYIIVGFDEDGDPLVEEKK